MKMKLIIASVLSLSILFFASCQKSKSDVLEFSNQSGSLKILCVGERLTSADPWVLNVSPMLNDSLYPGVEMEIYVEQPSKENIKIEWLSEQRAVLTITERDGTVRTLPVSLELE